MDRFKTVGYLLKDVSRRYAARFERHAQELSLTLMQCKVLLYLSKNEGASQVRLCELTEIEPMMMVRILDRMEADKLLERRPDPADRRARQLYLTRKAAPLLQEIDRLSELTRSEIFAGIGKAEREAFLNVLEHAHANAIALEAATTPAATHANAAGASRRGRTVHR